MRRFRLTRLVVEFSYETRSNLKEQPEPEILGREKWALWARNVNLTRSVPKNGRKGSLGVSKLRSSRSAYGGMRYVQSQK